MSAILNTYNRKKISFTKGKGAFLYGTNGKKYLDFVQGIAVNCLGHANKYLINSISKQSKKLWHVSNAFIIPEQEKLAKLFIEDVPKFGWSRETLLQCAKKQRISTSVLANLFPSFEYDVLKFIIAQNNSQVEKNYNSFNNSRLKTRDKIKTIMALKFENNSHLKKA